MTSEEFRRLALSLPGAEEKAHMDHPDFRVGGRIFATLGYPDNRHGTIMLSPQDQQLLLTAHPDAFAPAAGAWGRAGSTAVLLRLAPKRAVKTALEAAWRRRAPKSRKTDAKPRTRKAKR
jgi:hypothetical protein